MFWTLLAMLALVVTGGFISYYGDLQGRRWGKKRVSWFGMRPKHTAILITSLTGAAIAFLSVVAVLIAAPNVRAVVLRGEAAINENRRLNEKYGKQFDALQVELKTSAAQKSNIEQDLEVMNKQNAQAKAENGGLKGANHDLEQNNSQLTHGNMDLQRQQAALKRSIESNQAVIKTQKKEIANAAIINAELAHQNTDYSRKNDDLARANTDLKASNEKLKTTNLKLKTDNDKLVVATNLAEKSYDAANRAYNAQLDAYAKKEEQFKTLTEQVGGTKAQLEELYQQRDELKNLLAGTSQNFVREYISLRQTRYNLRAETELARRTLDAHSSPKAAKDEIMTLLKDASDRAKRFGAAVGENGRAVVIVSKRVVTPASVQMTDESASVNALVDAVAGSSTPVVLVARAINNTSANEQVLMELTPYSSSTVFQQDAVVATRPIDSRQPIEKLVESVILFLRADVRASAIKSGTIPQISPDSGEQEVGMIDTPELFTLLDRIRRTGGTVQLTAVANETITSGDLLTFGQSKGGAKPHNLRFDLKRISAATQAARGSGSAFQRTGEPATK